MKSVCSSGRKRANETGELTYKILILNTNGRQRGSAFKGLRQCQPRIQFRSITVSVKWESRGKITFSLNHSLNVHRPRPLPQSLLLAMLPQHEGATQDRGCPGSPKQARGRGKASGGRGRPGDAPVATAVRAPQAGPWGSPSCTGEPRGLSPRDTVSGGVSEAAGGWKNKKSTRGSKKRKRHGGILFGSAANERDKRLLREQTVTRRPVSAGSVTARGSRERTSRRGEVARKQRGRGAGQCWVRTPPGAAEPHTGQPGPSQTQAETRSTNQGASDIWRVLRGGREPAHLTPEEAWVTWGRLNTFFFNKEDGVLAF